MPAWDHPRGPAAARILVELGVDHGRTATECLVGSGLSPADLIDPDTQVEAGQELTIARNLLCRLGDVPGLGADAGSRYTYGALGIWGYAILSSPSVREMIRLGVRYAELSFAFIKPMVEPGEEYSAVVFDDAEIPPDVCAFFVERELTKIATLLPVIVGPRRGVRIETSFTGARASALRQRIGAIPLTTGTHRHAIVFDTAILDAPLPQSDSVVARALEQQCDQLLTLRHQRRGTAGHVRSLILAELDTSPSMETIAARLHLDERTLRRRLAAESTTFRELIDEIRATLADDLLTIDGITLGEIAGRLGYHDAASFSRAYRRWTGHTPRQLHRAIP
ncbi:AraC family transcriptional regulator [Nocardia sp. XZ_19_385]|uniref:AraC family transcriptional regulator n=1 Tax=Nocardia sp. XZ_19_385 TaxID=2769488 RepID=UPI0018905703|nr:AraC family transcriptional regulator [Nocardia sp. XZ_19_385]